MLYYEYLCSKGFYRTHLFVLRYKDGTELPASDPRVKQTVLPDGTVKLSIERVTPADCGAYKLVISNPHGDNSALCAVAVNRE